MQRMAATSTRTPTDEAHEAEVAQQSKIAEEVTETEQVPAAAVPDNPDADEQPVTQEVAKVTIRSVEAEVSEYPLTLSVVGSKDIVFDSASTTVEVSPEVAEQITYLTNVEVAE